VPLEILERTTQVVRGQQGMIDPRFELPLGRFHARGEVHVAVGKTGHRPAYPVASSTVWSISSRVLSASVAALSISLSCFSISVPLSFIFSLVLYAYSRLPFYCIFLTATLSS